MFMTSRQVSCKCTRVIFAGHARIRPRFAAMTSHAFNSQNYLYVEEATTLIIISATRIINFTRITMCRIYTYNSVFIFMLRIDHVSTRECISVFSMYFQFIKVNSHVITVMRKATCFRSQCSWVIRTNRVTQ